MPQLNQIPGSTVTFSVTVTGVTSPAYFWTRDGHPLSNTPGKYAGTGSSVLTVMNVQNSDEDEYGVVVVDSSTGGTQFSNTAELTVCKLVFVL